MVDAVKPVLEKEFVVGCPTGVVVPRVTVNPVCRYLYIHYSDEDRTLYLRSKVEQFHWLLLVVLTVRPVT